jgi:hypothetical protein
MIGMQKMVHRTTFALDHVTAERLKVLAARWHVSQSEAVRRAIAQAEAFPVPSEPDTPTLLRQLQESGQSLNRQKAEAYLDEVYEDRRRWRGR